MKTYKKSVVDFADSVKHRALLQELATLTNNPIVQEYCTRAQSAVTLCGERLVLDLKEFKDSASLIAYAQNELNGLLSWREIANKAARKKDVSAWVAAIKKVYGVLQSEEEHSGQGQKPYLLAALLLFAISLAQLAQAKEKYVPNATVTPEIVQRAVTTVPILRGMMRDPDSFVLENVYLRESTDKYAKDANSQPPSFCFFFRSHNAMGGYGDTGEALLNSKGKIEILDPSVDRSGVYIAMMTCTPKRRLADITTQVKVALNPAPVPAPALTPEEQAKRAQEYADCLKIAVSNESIACKQ